MDVSTHKRLAVLQRQLDPEQQLLENEGTSGASLQLDSEEVAGAPSPSRDRTAFNADRIHRTLFEPDYPEVRRAMRELFKDPIFRPNFDLTLEEFRALTLARIKKIVSARVFSLRDYKTDTAKFYTALEYLPYIDSSMATKLGVQYNLWGGSVLSLGTKRHHDMYVDDIDTLRLPGAFALTELGHGSNVRGIETQAWFDKARQEFVINTPSDMAQKIWIGNVACHGKMATVFAQLTLDGEDKGVHAFIVRIRNDDGTLPPGIRIADCGHKMGLNGVDNGRLWLDNVRVPRENLLNRYMDVLPDGTYVTDIPNPELRFATMIGELVGGRLGIAGGALNLAKAGLTIAIKYAATRTQFGPPGEGEIAILDYKSHQMRLFPLLAKTYAYAFCMGSAKEAFAKRSPETMKAVHVECAGLKAMCTWHKSDTLQVARECCGGMGFSSENRIGVWKTDTDIESTYEGDNVVLLQQVTRALLGDLKKQMRKGGALGAVALAFNNELTPFILDSNPVNRIMAPQDKLLDPAMYQRAFEYREYKLVTKLARKLHKLTTVRRMSGFDAWNACLDLVLDAAKAHVDKHALNKFIDGINGVHPDDKKALRTMCSLYALTTIEQHMGWYLSHKYFAPKFADRVHSQISKLYDEVRPMAVDLCDAFGIPQYMLHAPIAGDWLDEFAWKNTREARGDTERVGLKHAQ